MPVATPAGLHLADDWQSMTTRHIRTKHRRNAGKGSDVSKTRRKGAFSPFSLVPGDTQFSCNELVFVLAPDLCLEKQGSGERLRVTCTTLPIRPSSPLLLPCLRILSSLTLVLLLLLLALLLLLLALLSSAPLRPMASSTRLVLFLSSTRRNVTLAPFLHISRSQLPPADVRRKDARRQGYTRATKKQRSQQQSTRARSRFALARQHRRHRHRSLQAGRTARSHVSSIALLLPTLCSILTKKKGFKKKTQNPKQTSTNLF